MADKETSPRKSWKGGCHLARDLYYKCSQDAQSTCDVELETMFTECPLSWAKFYKGKALRVRHDATVDNLVEHFNRKLNEDENDAGKPEAG